MTEQIIQADYGISILVGMAVVGALGAAAALLSPKNKPLYDSRATILTDRGSPLPMLIGRRRIAGFLCYAGDRYFQKASGGKSFGGASGGGGSYWETGWHVLCVGPASRLTGIFENGKSIWSGDINPTNSPSGTHLVTRTGNAYIYWGEYNQAAHDRLATRLGTTSTWPCICYVFWDRKNLGGAAAWPNVEYELSAGVMDTVLERSAAWLPESAADAGDDGPNPAHVLWQILTAPAPWGCAISPDNLDAEAFEVMGELCATEQQPCHVLAGNGVAGEDLVAAILLDLGAVLPQVNGILVPAAIRHVDAAEIPVLTDDMLVVPAPPPRQQTHDAALPDRLVFILQDRANNYRDMDIVVDDDSQATLRNRTRQQRIEMTTVTDRRTGTKVADRRTQELLTSIEKYSLEVAHGARLLRPGQAFILPGYGQMRVGTVEPSIGTRTAKIEAVIDQYSGEPGTYVPANIDETFNTPVGVTPVADTLVVGKGLPAELSSTPAIVVARVRANQQISGANVWISRDGTSYRQIGTQDAAGAGGVLQEAIAASTDPVIEEGPVVTAYNEDIGGVEDLSSRIDDWEAGVQLAFIGDEVFFLRNVTAVTGGWRLEGLIRAQFGTVMAGHAIGDPVVIVTASDLSTLTNALIIANCTIYVKTQPRVGEELCDLSTVSAVTVILGSP